MKSRTPNSSMLHYNYNSSHPVWFIQRVFTSKPPLPSFSDYSCISFHSPEFCLQLVPRLRLCMKLNTGTIHWLPYLWQFFVYAHKELYSSVDARGRVKVKPPPWLFRLDPERGGHDVAECPSWVKILKQAHRELRQRRVVHMLTKCILEMTELSINLIHYECTSCKNKGKFQRLSH